MIVCSVNNSMKYTLTHGHIHMHVDNKECELI